jgi:outer membrane immunogenic protein
MDMAGTGPYSLAIAISGGRGRVWRMASRINRRHEMAKKWLKGVAIAALTVAGAAAAQAADLPTRKEAPAPIFVPPPFTWTGFYVGLNAGGIISSGSRSATLYYPPADAWLASYFPGGFGNNQSGFIGGGQAGYDWQTGAFVLGVVTDFDGTTLSKSFNFQSAPFTAAGIYTGDTLNVNGKASLTWLGTTRGKVGFVATPDNRLLIYGTGGVAYGGGSSYFNLWDGNNNFYWSGNNGSGARVGWTAGAGIEYALTNNWEIGAEYLYADLGSRTITTTPNALAAAVFPNVYATAKINYDASIIRAFVNYKF